MNAPNARNARRFDQDALRTWAVVAVMAAGGAAWSLGRLPPRAAAVVEIVRDDGPNEIDMDEMTQNYYEGLLEMDREPSERGGLATELASWFRAREALPTGWREQKEPMAFGPDKDFLFRENIPNFDGVYKGVHVRMNRWGHRSSHDYDQAKPAGVFRIAMAGGSNTMGFGVKLEDTFAYRLEALLNESHSGAGRPRYEVLNFSSNGHHLLEKTYVATTRFAAFGPDLAIVDVLASDLGASDYDFVARRLQEGRDLHFDFVREIIEKSDAKPDDSRTRLRQRLKPYRLTLADCCLRELKRFQDSSGIPVVIMALRDDVRGTPAKLQWLARAAEKHGLTVVRIFDSLEGGGQDMYVHPRDFHLSGKAQRLVGEELYTKLLQTSSVRALVEGAKD